MKPNFEPFVHTARDLVERGIINYESPGGEIWRQLLSQSEIPEYRKIADSMIITESWDQFNEMTKNELLSQGTHSYMGPYLVPYILAWATEVDHDQGRYKYNSGRGFYRGEKVSGDNPMTGYLTHKKWNFNEVIMI